jgi:hypothetical protein
VLPGFVVVHKGDGVREGVACLPLRPIDDLRYVSTGHVIGVGPAMSGCRPSAMQVDPEPRARVLPAGVAFIDLDDRYGIHVESLPAINASTAHRQISAHSAACETSHGVRASSDVLVEGGPGGVFVVGAVGFEAAVEDADESVGELAQGGVVVLAAVGELVVVGPGRG